MNADFKGTHYGAFTYEDIEDNGLDILLQANIEAEQIIHNMNH